MSKETEVEEKTTAPMKKGDVVMEVSLNPAGRAILAAEGWEEVPAKK